MRYTAMGRSTLMDLNMATSEKVSYIRNKVSYIWNNVSNYNL